MSLSKTEQMVEKLREIEAQRYEKLQKFGNDPYINYPTLDDAISDYKFTSQAETLAKLLNRENVFISGPAGSGKTTIINRFIELIDAEYSGNFEIAITASTGIAATLIGGQTIHSWAGMGISSEPFNPKKVAPMMWSKANNLRYTDVLIIDEISMLPAYLFDNLNKALQFFRRNKKPFGGIQLVVLGDFLQLPPVKGKADSEVNTDFSVYSEAWKEADFTYCYMDKTHRATDKKLKYLLSHIAAGKIDETTKRLIAERSKKTLKPDPKKTYTTLFTTNNNVDTFNKNELNKNPNKLVTVNAIENGLSKNIEKIYKQQGVLKELHLKVGATVMLTSNIKSPVTGDLYANGSIGVIETFVLGIPRVRFNDGVVLTIDRKTYNLTEKKTYLDKNKNEVSFEETIASVSQVPLKLGYAITVHKSQGQTFDGVIADLSKCFTPGLGYVALSRVRSLDDLIITDFNNKAYSIDEKSMRINRIVKKFALKSREALLKDKEHYEALLTSNIYRGLYWNPETSGGSRMRKNNV